MLSAAIRGQLGNTHKPREGFPVAFTCDYQATPMPSPTLRTTLGTQLARAGVAPQITQRIMRHADFRTTNRVPARNKHAPHSV